MSQNPIKTLSPEDIERIEAIEELVLKYQKEKSEEAATGLLWFLKPMLLKYTRIIKEGTVKWDDKGTQTFLYAFLGPHGNSEAERQIVYQDKLRIMTLIFGQLPTGDVFSEMQLILFTLISRYEPMDRTFIAYLAAAFPYEVARYVRKFTASQSTWHPRCDSFEQYYVEELVEHEFLDEIEYFEVEENQDIIDEFGFLNDEWVKKADCFAFARLKPEERQLIKMYYQERQADIEISQHLNCHINTANQKRRKAVKEVADFMGIEPGRSRNPKQEDRKGIKKIAKSEPIHQPITIESRIESSACDKCLHIRVCKYQEWYKERIKVFRKSQLLEDIDCENFIASFTCSNHLAKEA